MEWIIFSHLHLLLSLLILLSVSGGMRSGESAGGERRIAALALNRETWAGRGAGRAGVGQAAGMSTGHACLQLPALGLGERNRLAVVGVPANRDDARLGRHLP